ncbi:hypothetical protein OBBRIDRAFT_839057 [Obba rivulosa]|uniref:Uncharacterized protein n=1 Tax=Obba rivulosa TaxID=1052685 RepID=A0A8E2DFX2_9APHY|nr:hypothetical protein OBBRIDRAFT_839057 [Obba rivulosa]
MSQAQARGRRLSPADDTVLIFVLLAGKHIKQGVRQTLEELSGINGRSVVEWKDYYLDHAEGPMRRLALRLKPEVLDEADRVSYPAKANTCRTIGLHHRITQPVLDRVLDEGSGKPDL